MLRFISSVNSAKFWCTGYLRNFILPEFISLSLTEPGSGVPVMIAAPPPARMLSAMFCEQLLRSWGSLRNNISAVFWYQKYYCSALFPYLWNSGNNCVTALWKTAAVITVRAVCKVWFSFIPSFRFIFTHSIKLCVKFAILFMLYSCKAELHLLLWHYHEHKWFSNCGRFSLDFSPALW